MAAVELPLTQDHLWALRRALREGDILAYGEGHDSARVIGERLVREGLVLEIAPRGRGRRFELTEAGKNYARTLERGEGAEPSNRSGS